MYIDFIAVIVEKSRSTSRSIRSDDSGNKRSRHSSRSNSRGIV